MGHCDALTLTIGTLETKIC